MSFLLKLDHKSQKESE